MATNMDSLTMAEIHKVETIAGKSIQALADQTAPNARLMTAIAYVIELRKEPGLNFEKFENEATLDMVMQAVAGGDDEEKK